MIRPDFVSTQEAVDDDFYKDIENFKYARRVKGSDASVTKVIMTTQMLYCL